MSTIQITTKTAAQIAAAFAAVYKDVKPIPAAKPLTQADRLAPYGREIRKLRRRGLTWRQIAEGMSDPRIGETVTEKLLKRVFAPGAASSPASAGAARAGAAAPAAPPHYVLDPLTNLPVARG